jgi:hypothetical protein
VYRLRVHLEDERRTIVIPNRFRVDTEAPTITLVRLTPRRLSPDGDGVRDEAKVAFRLSQPGRVLVLVDGLVAARGRREGAGEAELLWPGRHASGPVRAGYSVVALEAQDRAGNMSPPTAGVRVQIRYVELADVRSPARRGGVLRFRVLADARRVRWTLSPARDDERRALLRGAGRPGFIGVRLPPRIRAGRYVLRVAASGHHDQAPITIRARS